jgi:hypothetical protein
MRWSVATMACWLAAAAGRGAEPGDLPPSHSVRPELYATGFEFAEGPALDPAGNLFVVNYRGNGKIGRIAPDGTASVFCDLRELVPLEGRLPQANGLKVDRQGRVLAADAGAARLLRIAPDGRTVEVLADRWQGNRFNALNDVALDLAGNIYFSDPGSSNADTRLDIIDLATFTKTTVNKTSSMTGDFRDVTIVDANTAYVFLGNYNSSWSMDGGVYRTTVANLTSPSAWTKVSNLSSAPGYLWGIYADSNRFWFVKGNQIDIYPGLPASTSDAATKTFTPTQLGYTGGNLNSAIILAPDQTSSLLAARSASGVAKSFASQSVLAQQARKAAEEAKTGLKTVNGQRILSFN